MGDQFGLESRVHRTGDIELGQFETVVADAVVDPDDISRRIAVSTDGTLLFADVTVDDDRSTFPAAPTWS